MRLPRHLAPLGPLAASLSLSVCLSLTACSSSAVGEGDGTSSHEAVSTKPGTTYARALAACHDARAGAPRPDAADALRAYWTCLSDATTAVVPAIEKRLADEPLAKPYRGKTVQTFARVRLAWAAVCGELLGTFDPGSDSRMPPGAVREDDEKEVRGEIVQGCMADGEIFLAREIAALVDLGAEVPTAGVLPDVSGVYGTACTTAHDAADGDTTAAMNAANDAYRACMRDLAKGVSERFRPAPTDGSKAAWSAAIDEADAANDAICTVLVQAGANVGGTLSSVEESSCAAHGAVALGVSARKGADDAPDPGQM